ncbi:MAG: hypothetical protein IPL28_13505 [Chloroflexi bacterium]|nr:hypothetical protein [Chloroflexota bacterium]
MWVRVQPQPAQLSVAEKLVLLRQLHGAWAGDASIPTVLPKLPPNGQPSHLIELI